MKSPPDLAAPLLWVVCFVGKERARWWNVLLAPGFRHCFMLGYEPYNGVWLLYDVQFTHSTVAIVSAQRAHELVQIALDEGDALSVEQKFHVKRTIFDRIGFWCVPAARHLLGIRCVAVTPRGLHRYLVRMGAKSLKADTSGPVLCAESKT